MLTDLTARHSAGARVQVSRVPSDITRTVLTIVTHRYFRFALISSHPSQVRVTVGHYYSGEFRCWLIAAAIDSITMPDIVNCSTPPRPH